MRGLLSPRWIAVHVAALMLVAGFLGLGWWQLGRAAGGNLLSVGYAVEWPAFAAFVIFMWAREIRQAQARHRGPAGAAAASPDRMARQAQSTGPAQSAGRVRRARSGPAYDDSADPQLAAYNHYLAWLAAHPDASRSDYWQQPERG